MRGEGGSSSCSWLPAEDPKDGIDFFFEDVLFLHIDKTGNSERYGELSLRTRKLDI